MIYTFIVYVPIIEMRKCGLRFFSLVTTEQSRHSFVQKKKTEEDTENTKATLKLYDGGTSLSKVKLQ